MLTGVHALQIHGFAHDATVPMVPFLVPHTSRTRVRAAGLETIRTKRLPAPIVRQDLRIAPIERALADASRLRQLTDRQLRGIGIAVLQNRRTTVDRLAAEIEFGRPNATGGLVEATVEFRRGSWSVPEADLAALVRDHPDLPAMLLNPRLKTASGQLIGTPDGYFPDAGVVVQVHSTRHHDGHDEEGNDRLASTLDKDLDYPAHDLAVAGVAPTSLRDRPQAFLRKLVAIVTPRLGWHSDDVVVA